VELGPAHSITFALEKALFALDKRKCMRLETWLCVKPSTHDIYIYIYIYTYVYTYIHICRYIYLSI